MDDKTWQYLSILDEDDPTLLSDKLADVLENESGVNLGVDESTDVNLPFVGSLSFTSDCPPSKQSFFKWLAKQLERRRRRKFDELTGLYTRSYWEREMKASAGRQSWAMAMGDIDHFKRFNDNHGHDMGDRVLDAVGNLLLEELPNDSKLIRYGGEEILILLDMEFSQAMKRLEELRERLSTSQLFPDQPSAITMSFGLAEHGEGDSIDESIKQADLALYESKGSGRNRITTYAPYLDYSSRMYVWGIYRYIWTPKIRFSLDSEGLKFLLLWGDSLQWYDWGDNQSIYSYIPSGCEQPIRSIRRGSDGFVLLDGAGDLWGHEPGDSFNRITTDSDPVVSRLTGQKSELRAVGVNNQLYELLDGELERTVGLPEAWDQLVVSNGIYVAVENILVEWTGENCAESWPLPESPRQITTTGNSIVMVGESGRLFKFRPEVHHWEQTQFMNLIGNWVPCREVSSVGERLLILDEHGRLLLAYERGDKKKSVPQAMNLKDPR